MTKLMYCPSCDTEHWLDVVFDTIYVTDGFRRVCCRQTYYKCGRTGEKFLDGKMLNENLRAAREILEKEQPCEDTR